VKPDAVSAPGFSVSKAVYAVARNVRYWPLQNA